jgi:hypothetical protein
VIDEREQIVDASAGFVRMAKWRRPVDRIAVAATVAFARKHSGVLEIGENLLDRAFGDVDHFSKIANARVGIADERNENVRVIGQIRPLRARTRLPDRAYPAVAVIGVMLGNFQGLHDIHVFSISTLESLIDSALRFMRAV